jgi:hypothetical protein
MNQSKSSSRCIEVYLGRARAAQAAQAALALRAAGESATPAPDHHKPYEFHRLVGDTPSIASHKLRNASHLADVPVRVST